MKGFWSVDGVFTARKLAVMGLLVAVQAVMAPLLNVYLTPDVRLFSFVYLPGAVVAVLFGPIAGMAFGLVGDFVAWLVTPNNGFYFPGFAMSAVLTNLTYAVFLYCPSGKPAVAVRVLAAQAVVLIVINLGLNMLWLNLMYGTSAGAMYTWFRIALKLTQFPIDVVLICFCVRISERWLSKIV